MTRTRWAQVLLVTGVVAAPLLKGSQFHWHEGKDQWRQLALVLGAAVAVAVVTRRPLEALVGSQVALPRPPLPEWFSRARVARLALGIAAIGFCGASVAAAVAGDRVRTVGFTAAALLAVVALGGWEAGRHLHAQATRARDGPDRAVLWVVAPGVLLWTILILFGAVTGSAFDGALAERGLLFGGAPGRALFTVLVIGVGEEYLYRGMLLLLAIRAELPTVGLTLVSLSFGFWHLPDAQGDGAAVVVVTVAAMTLVSQLVLIPIRLRCRSLAGPALLHTANNLAMNMLRSP